MMEDVNCRHILSTNLMPDIESIPDHNDGLEIKRVMFKSKLFSSAEKIVQISLSFTAELLEKQQYKNNFPTVSGALFCSDSETPLFVASNQFLDTSFDEGSRDKKLKLKVSCLYLHTLDSNKTAHFYIRAGLNFGIAVFKQKEIHLKTTEIDN